MTFEPDSHHRRSIRLSGYDYGSSGFYFVTLCLQHRESLLGSIAADAMQLNDAGRMVEQWWCKLPEKFPTVALDHFVFMPNHLHAILQLTSPSSTIAVGADPCVRPGLSADPPVLANVWGPENQGGHAGPPLPKIIQWFKTMTTNACIRGVKNNGWPPFAGRLWQRNYYEHIIRNENELRNARQYIRDNPVKWASDHENPDNHE